MTNAKNKEGKKEEQTVQMKTQKLTDNESEDGQRAVKIMKVKEYECNMH